MDEERLGQRVHLRESSGDSKAGAVCDLVVQAACPIVTCPSACDSMGDGQEQDASPESSTLMPSAPQHKGKSSVWEPRTEP